MAEDERKPAAPAVDGIAKARDALTRKDGVLEGDPGKVAENAKPAAGERPTPAGRPEEDVPKDG